MSFTPFNATLLKKKKNWPKFKNGEYVVYPVLSVDMSVIDSPTPIDGEGEPVERMDCWILLANPINGRIEWFNITDIRFHSIL